MEQMVGLDAKFLYSETAASHMHTIKVVVSDVSSMPEGFIYEGFVDVLRRHISRLPPFRRRVIFVPFGLGHPMWVEDPDFDLLNHVSRHQMSPPASMRDLAEVIGDIASRPLPRNRPLWEMVVVDGIGGDRMAVIAKIHHAVADGSATVALLQNVVQGIDEVQVDEQGAELSIGLGGDQFDDWIPDRIPTSSQLLKIAMREHANRFRNLPDLVLKSIKGARDSEARRRKLQVRPPLPLQTPRTSFNVSIDHKRTFAMTTLPLEDIQAIRRVFGTTFNDVYLAVCSGALRRYLKARGERPGRNLIASVPLSTDPNVARMSGNRVDNLYVSLGTEIEDPIERLMHCSSSASGAKQVRGALGTGLLEQRAEVVPPQLYKAAVKLWSRSRLANRVRPPINVITSNVAGPRVPIRFGPIDLEALYSVGPILEGVGLNITAWSYVDGLHVSVLGSPKSIPDPWLLIDALHESLDELIGICHNIAGAPGEHAETEPSPVNAPNAAKGKFSNPMDEFISLAKSDVDSGWLPACQFAVAKNGELLAFETFGDAVPDTHFCIFSATKPIVASAIWFLIGDGKLDIHRSVGSYIPEFAANGKQDVTVEQVLLHTCGFPSAPMWPSEGADRNKRLERFASWTLEFEAGTKFQYHAQSAHWVLAELIDRLAGVDYRKFINDRVSLPLGLGYILGSAVGSQPQVAPLTWVGKASTSAGPGDLSFQWDDPQVIAAGSPGGGGIATAAQMVMFYQALLNNPDFLWIPEVLEDATANIRCRFSDPMMGVPVNRTIGLVVAGNDGLHTMRYGAFGEGNAPGSFGHAGAHVQVAWADPATGISFCFLTNGLDTDTMREGVHRLRLSNLAAKL